MKRNKHNLSHYKLFSADMGKLYPISCFEALPGDTLQMSSSVFLRFAPMLSPVIHPIKVGIYSFLCPIRLLWNNGPDDNFEDFITGGPDGLDDATPPTVTATQGVAEGSLADYLGVPVGYTGPYSDLPARAYNLIFNEYFRDQDLQNEANFSTTGGNENINNGGTILPVSWEKDYFTTCRPWPQKGPTVTVPVNGINSGTYSVSQQSRNGLAVNIAAYEDSSSNTIPAGSSGYIEMDTSGFLKVKTSGPNSLPPPGSETVNMVIDPYHPNTFGSVTIPANNGANIRLDDLREAFALQRFEEHRAAYGSRYTEYLRYLGVRSSDARLQRPEYLGGGKTTMQISEVLQTAADGDNPVGTLRGHGIGAVASRTFRRFVEEHSIIITLMKIQPIAIYEQGLNKMFSRKTKEDYWQRELEHIGQQEVMTRELYSSADADKVFGYNNRYDEYRGIPSTVAGEMRSTLDFWHMARNFANEPVLNSSFIAGSPTKRIFAEQTMNEVYCLAQHKVVARRILSKQGNPIL